MTFKIRIIQCLVYLSIQQSRRRPNQLTIYLFIYFFNNYRYLEREMTFTALIHSRGVRYFLLVLSIFVVSLYYFLLFDTQQQQQSLVNKQTHLHHLLQNADIALIDGKITNFTSNWSTLISESFYILT